MTRLIDADALLQTLNDEDVPYDADVNYFIMNAPTIDVVPRSLYEKLLTKHTQTDLISRADAIEAVHKVTIDLLQDRCMPIGCATDFTDAIRELPSALPSAEAKEGDNNER